jgi:hypothetical protein
MKYENLKIEFPIKYICTIEELDLFLDEIRPELNDRLENTIDKSERIFIIISNYNKFFETITDEQASFMRKITQYINDVKYGIYFVCGFDTNQDKNDDRMFNELVVNARNYIICPNSYYQASQKVEKIPLIQNIRSSDAYFCHGENNTKVRW